MYPRYESPTPLLLILVCVAAAAFLISLQIVTRRIANDPAYRAEYAQKALVVREAAECQMLANRPSAYKRLKEQYELMRGVLNVGLMGASGQDTARPMLTKMPDFQPIGYYGYMASVWESCKQKGYFLTPAN